MRGEGIASNEVDQSICFSPYAAVDVLGQSLDRKSSHRHELLDGGFTMAKKKAAKKAVKKVAKKTAKKKTGKKC